MRASSSRSTRSPPATFGPLEDLQIEPELTSPRRRTLCISLGARRAPGNPLFCESMDLFVNFSDHSHLPCCLTALSTTRPVKIAPDELNTPTNVHAVSDGFEENLGTPT